MKVLLEEQNVCRAMSFRSWQSVKPLILWCQDLDFSKEQKLSILILS